MPSKRSTDRDPSRRARDPAGRPGRGRGGAVSPAAGQRLTAGPEFPRHQERALALLRATERGALAVEVAVPEGSRRIDALLELGRPNRIWGPLLPALSRRRILFEHFSGPPSIEALTTVHAKLALVLEAWARSRRVAARRGLASIRPPLGLVLSVGRPAGALQVLGYVPRGPSGVHVASLGAFEAVLVDVRGLPPEPGTALLRAFDHRPAVASRNLARLLVDPALDWRTRRAIGDAVMAKPKLWDPLEQQVTVDLLLQRGRVEGLRAALRVVLSHRVPERAASLEAAVAACDDAALLERAIALVTGATEDDPPSASALTKLLRGRRRAGRPARRPALKGASGADRRAKAGAKPRPKSSR